MNNVLQYFTIGCNIYCITLNAVVYGSDKDEEETWSPGIAEGGGKTFCDHPDSNEG
jgi:hypothetical protein